MNLNDYQKLAMETAVFPNNPHNALFYTALGLASEAGEYAGKVKKLLRDAEFSRADASRELGDVLWYVAAAADALGLDLATVAEENITKLRDRKERGTLRGSGDHR
jgi:NTP pyrophosphatase (non-canonical NTP hydrolase)